jgi:tetratricopeptide (TPR) repeat protein
MRPRIFQAILIVSIVSVVIPGVGWGSTAQDYLRDGYVASMKREWYVAVDFFNKSIHLNPDNAIVYVQRALAYQMIDRNDDAIRDYEAALKLRPDYYLAMEYLANLYEAKNEYSRAVEIYNRALTLVRDPKWRSVIQWKILEAKKRSVNTRADQGKQPTR